MLLYYSNGSIIADLEILARTLRPVHGPWPPILDNTYGARTRAVTMTRPLGIRPVDGLWEAYLRAVDAPWETLTKAYAPYTPRGRCPGGAVR